MLSRSISLLRSSKISDIYPSSYLMDKFMHAIGVHGKSIIPILLGFGCNVPSVLLVRLWKPNGKKAGDFSQLELFHAPARTTIILGLVAKYVGWQYAMLLYIVDFIVVIIIGKMLESCRFEQKNGTYY